MSTTTPTTWFTGDTHFGHNAMVNPRFGSYRGFAKIEDHDATLIERWNAVVGPRDVVRHLGDFAHRCDKRRMRDIFHRLHGSKHLIIGNHDDAETLRLPWASKHDLAQVVVEDTRLVLCHYGLRVWPGGRRSALHLYGHSHGRLPGWRNSADVGVDAWDLRPVSLPEIRARMALQPEVEAEERLEDGLEEEPTPGPR